MSLNKILSEYGTDQGVFWYDQVAYCFQADVSAEYWEKCKAIPNSKTVNIPGIGDVVMWVKTAEQKQETDEALEKLRRLRGFE